MSDNRISVTRRTARWSDEPVTAADAMDFWSFAAGAANVIMQLSRPGVDTEWSKARSTPAT